MEASHTEYLCRKYEKASMPQNKGQNRSWRLKKNWKATLSIVVQLLSHVRLFVTPWTAACQASVFHHLPEFAQTHVHWVSDALHTEQLFGSEGNLFSCLFLRFPYCKPLSSFFLPSSSFQPGRGRVSLCLVNEGKSVETNPYGIAYTSLVLPRSGVDSKSA